MFEKVIDLFLDKLGENVGLLMATTIVSGSILVMTMFSPGTSLLLGVLGFISIPVFILSFIITVFKYFFLIFCDYDPFKNEDVDPKKSENQIMDDDANDK